MFLPHPRVKVSIVGSLRDREVACSASDRQGSNFESCVWRTVSSQSSHHPQEVLLAQFSLYVHKGGLKPDSFHFISFTMFPSCCISFRNKLTSNLVPTNTRHWYNVVLMLVQRLRRWPNIKTTLVKGIVFSGSHFSLPLSLWHKGTEEGEGGWQMTVPPKTWTAVY